jgi:hypothetical protein
VGLRLRNRVRRVAFSMTIDPEGAMHDWVDPPTGWELIRVPTQEAVQLVGIAAYQEMLVEICERERPEILVTHPPYDHLGPAAAERIRAAGTRVIGYAFDDEIFAGSYDAATGEAIGRTYDRYLTTRDVRWATAPLPSLPARECEFDVALVGRAYRRRSELVEALRAAGISVATRGAGWPEGFVSRAQMLDTYARAAIVLTTADWESFEVPMVKHRLLDTAMLGAFQIAQEAPDLRGYFSVEEVPSYRDAPSLIEAVRAALADPAGRREKAAAARRRALAEHTWQTRFSELLDGISFEDERPEPERRSGLLDQILIALASRAEADGRIAAAAALFAERLSRGFDPAAAAGQGRCLRELGDPEAALAPLRAAVAAAAPPCAAALDVTIPPAGVGTGLGRLRLFPPGAEPLVHLVAALVELDREAEAAALLDATADPVLARSAARAIDLAPELAAPSLRAALDRARLR